MTGTFGPEDLSGVFRLFTLVFASPCNGPDLADAVLTRGVEGLPPALSFALPAMMSESGWALPISEMIC